MKFDPLHLCGTPVRECRRDCGLYDRFTDHVFNLTALDDDQYAMPPYHAILLVNGERAEDQKLRSALSPLIDGIDSATMRQLNSRFDIDKEDPETIAREYLVSRGLIAS